MPGDAVQRLLLAVSGMLSARKLAIAGGGVGQSMHLCSYRTNVLHHATARQSALLYTPPAGRRTTAFVKPSDPVSRAAPFRSAWERAATRRQAKPTTQRLIGVSSGAGQAASAGWYNEDALFSAGSGGTHVRGRHGNGGGRACRGLALAVSAVGRPQQLARLSWPTASLLSYTQPDAHVQAGSSGGDVPGPGHDLTSKQGVSIPERGVSATRESSAAPGAGSRRQAAGREARAGMGEAAATAAAAAAAAAAADAAVAVGEGNNGRLGWGVTDEEEKGGDGEWCPRAARASACEAVPQLTEAFREFDEKHPGATIIYLAHSGSRLYGTNTAKSDVDLKGIFIPDVQKEEEARRAAAQVKAVAKAQQDMGGDAAVPGDAKEARVPSSSSPALSPKSSGKGKEITFWYSTSNCDSRNTMHDVDVEIISLGRFFGQLIRGEIGGVETLHSMLVRDVELISDPEIVPIVVRERRWMVSSQLASWMGFILSHIHKYRRVTQDSNAARFRHKAFLRKRSLTAAAKPPPAAAAAAATATAPTSRGPGDAAPTSEGSSNTSNRVTTVSVPPQAAAGARVGNRVADRPAQTAATGTDTGDNSSLHLVSASSTLEASTTVTEAQNKRVSPEKPAKEAGDLSRVSSRGGGGEGAGEKSTAVDTAPAGVAVEVRVPPVRKLGVIGRKKAPTGVVKDAAPEEGPRLGVISRPGTGDAESGGAASSQGVRRLGVLSRGGVKMGGERVAEKGANEEEEEEDWEEKETARTLKRGKLLMHARRGVMEAEELLTAGRLTFPLKPRYVEELRCLKELDMGRKKLSSIQAQAKQLSAVAAASGLPAQVSMEKLRAVQEEVMRVHDKRRRRGVGPLPAVEAQQGKP
ncbi:unnamed protein product [Ectocarpus sp. 4 AP-2014]